MLYLNLIGVSNTYFLNHSYELLSMLYCENCPTFGMPCRSSSESSSITIVVIVLLMTVESIVLKLLGSRLSPKFILSPSVS